MSHDVNCSPLFPGKAGSVGASGGRLQQVHTYGATPQLHHVCHGCATLVRDAY
jgi:hypothetical protein